MKQLICTTLLVIIVSCNSNHKNRNETVKTTPSVTQDGAPGKNKQESTTETVPENPEVVIINGEKTIPFIPPVVNESVEHPIENVQLETKKVKQPESNFALDPPPTPIKITETPAQFPGGQNAMKTFLNKNLNNPLTGDDREGKTYLRFVVSETGVISDIRVTKGFPNRPECDAEAIRVLKMMPNWIPGKINGKAVSSYYNLPIIFRLD